MKGASKRPAARMWRWLRARFGPSRSARPRGANPLVRPERGLRPARPLRGKKNFKRYFRIETDGTILERVLLDCTDPQLREEIILKHILRMLARGQLDLMTAQFEIVGRDEPWDFTVREVATDAEFHIEVTAIAESTWLFEKLKREERLLTLGEEPRITLHMRKKVAQWFPDEEELRAVQGLEEAGLQPEDLVDNPRFQAQPIFISDTKDESDDLLSLIVAAVESKASKKHEAKHDTLLVIENRTLRFDWRDIANAVEAVERLSPEWPFREVLLYTGYYSDSDGNEAEYMVTPLQVTDHLREILEDLAERRPSMEEESRC